MARRAAMELRRGQTANLGFGVRAMVLAHPAGSRASAGRHLGYRTGCHRWYAVDGFCLRLRFNADAYMPSPQQFIYFQGAGSDVSFLSFLEIDTEGNVNVSKLWQEAYLTAGCGGSWTLPLHARKIVFFGTVRCRC
ncbi:MAG: hypothetical protein R3D03_01245 [Geminicoccaceae bacterium]